MLNSSLSYTGAGPAGELERKTSVVRLRRTHFATSPAALRRRRAPERFENPVPRHPRKPWVFAVGFLLIHHCLSNKIEKNWSG